MSIPCLLFGYAIEFFIESCEFTLCFYELSVNHMLRKAIGIGCVGIIIKDRK